MVSKLVNKGAVVFDYPLNAVGMKFTLVYQFTTRPDRQKLAGLVTVIFILNDCFYVFHNTIILAHNAIFVNS